MVGTRINSNSDDIDPVAGGILVLFSFALLFFGSAYFAYGELKYIIWGRTAEATIYGRQRYKYQDKDHPDGPDIIQWDIFFQWEDADDGLRRDRIALAPFVEPPADYKVQIDYVPGEFNSRPAGQRSYVAIVFVLMSLTAIVTWFVVVWIIGMRHARRRGKPSMPSDIFKRWRRPTNVNYGRGERRRERPSGKRLAKKDLSGW